MAYIYQYVRNITNLSQSDNMILSKFIKSDEMSSLFISICYRGKYIYIYYSRKCHVRTRFSLVAGPVDLMGDSSGCTLWMSYTPEK